VYNDYQFSVFLELGKLNAEGQCARYFDFGMSLILNVLPFCGRR